MSTAWKEKNRVHSIGKLTMGYAPRDLRHENPGTCACAQIERFSSSDEDRVFGPFFPAIEYPMMSTSQGGHYQLLRHTIRAGRKNGRWTSR